jgi:hypothetical protein
MTIKYLDSKRISVLSEDNVTWDASNTTGFSISGNTVTSTTSGWTNTYARSTQSFTVGNGEVEIAGTVDLGSSHDGRIGFNTGTVSGSNYNVFEWYADGGYSYVFENNVQKFEVGGGAARSQGDIYTVKIDNAGEVTYYFNGVYQYTSTVTASGTYYIDVKANVSGSIITGTIVDVKPTNVQDNSILVEKDTGRRYWFETATAPTYSGDLGTWETDGTQVTESSDVVTMNIQTRSTNQAVTNDLGANLSDSAWVMRCKLILSTITGGSGSTVYLELGVGSASASTGFANGGITQDFIGLQQRKSSDTDGWGLVGYDSTGTLDNPESPEMDTDPTTRTYYVEIKRLSTTSMSIGLYDSADYNTLISGLPVETKTDVPSGVTGLRYIRVGNAGMISETSGNVIAGTVQDIEIYNGVTSATPATWTRDSASFNETFTGTQDASWSSSGSRISIDTVNKRLKFDDVNDNTTDYLSKIFPEGALSDTMWTMLGQETFINSSSNLSAGVAQACYGAGNSNLDIKDNTNLSAIVAFIGGCGTNKTHRAMAHYYGANGTSQSACYSGSFSTEYWDTLWRESATTMRYKVFSDGRSRATNVLDAPVTITNTLTGLDRFLAVGGNHGVTTRHTYGYVNAIEFWDGVNK